MNKLFSKVAKNCAFAIPPSQQFRAIIILGLGNQIMPASYASMRIAYSCCLSTSLSSQKVRDIT